MLSGHRFLGGSTADSNWVVLSPHEHAALVVVSPQMLRFPYHIRYEYIEFALFTLAARVQRLVPLHAACVGRAGRGILLMGPSGAGKSTVALHCLLHGLDFLAEDAVFVAADTLQATGIANYLHVGDDSLRWLERSRDRAMIRRSPMIRRRSGVRKFEVDLRRPSYRLAPSPLKIIAVVFLSPEPARDRPLLRSLPRKEMLSTLDSHQPYAANQPRWRAFGRNLSQLEAFELRRGGHPREAVGALQALLREGRAAPTRRISTRARPCASP
jgi:energy-coupling factor transporter ATP-binding protein EcfA2